MDGREAKDRMYEQGTFRSGGDRRSTLDELADWTVWADKVVTF